MSGTSDSKSHVKFSIGLKLVAITTFIVIASTAVVVIVSQTLFKEDATRLAYVTAHDVSSQLSTETHGFLDRVVNTLTTMTEIEFSRLDRASRGTALVQQFNRNEDILAIGTWRRGADHPVVIDGAGNTWSKYENFIKTLKPSDKSWDGEIDLRRVTVDGQGLMAVSFPLSIDKDKKVLSATVGLLSQTTLLKYYGKAGWVTSYLVDREGNVLAHPKAALVDSGANFKNVPIVKRMMESSSNNETVEFTDADKEVYLGAFRSVGVGGVGVISQVSKEKALEAAEKVVARSWKSAGVILFLLFGFIYIFSKTLTGPIKALVDLTREIAAGNFKIKVEPKGHDEITLLTKSFGDMAVGLAERDKLKETFNKFHSKEIAEAILKGEIKLGGNRQEATVFFSDIRSFTSMSEELEAEQVVEMLNEYMTAMVAEIQKHSGVVDKYVGDAIMAVWGVPRTTPDDTWNAVRASIAMRARLNEFNQDRLKRGLKPVMIGMGLHTGELIAGNIGSTEKMEYTVIGDTVNTASRIESLTKEFGTDMLISDDVYKKVKDRVIVEAVSAQVKGKSKALTAYKVRGYYDEAGKPVIVETPYSSYEAGHSDKVVHNKAS